MIRKTLIISVLTFLYLALGCRWARADEEKPIKLCLPPSTGPAWLQDFTPLQKDKVDVTWEATDKTATYTIDGTYPEIRKDKVTYSDYSNETSIEAIEKWKCGSDQQSQFVSMMGEMENEVEWETKTDEKTESFEQEDDFVILNINEVRHIEHESERTIKINTPWTKHESTEELEWVQSWDANKMPAIKGEYEFESEERLMTPPSDKKKRHLANAVVIPGFQPTPLELGRVLTVETEKEGKLNGPIDPTLLQTTQIVKQWEGEKLIEEKQIHIKETRYYISNPQTKGYDFISLNEHHNETSKNTKEGKLSTINQLQTWTDLNSPPDRVSFWKESFQSLGMKKSSSFTISSKGHDILPKLFDVKDKNGSFTRITDFNPRGKIIRFLVLYFPSSNIGNETKMDLKFSDTGKLTEMLVDDGKNDMETYKDPFNDPAALYTLQNKITAVKTMEELAGQRSLPSRKTHLYDYPKVYEKKENY